MAGMKFSIRDVLLLTVIVALALGWWVDNKRIEKAVTKAESEQRLLQADFKDRMTVFDEMEKGTIPRGGMVSALSKRNVQTTESPEKSKSPQD
jgi:hypothetical protein